MSSVMPVPVLVIETGATPSASMTIEPAPTLTLCPANGRMPGCATTPDWMMNESPPVASPMFNAPSVTLASRLMVFDPRMLTFRLAMSPRSSGKPVPPDQFAALIHEYVFVLA